MLSRRAHERHDVLLHVVADMDTPDSFAGGEEVGRSRDGGNLVERLRYLAVAARNCPLRRLVRIPEVDADQEAVEMGLGQREGALQLDWILRGEHQKRVGQWPRLALSAHLALL